MTKQPWMEGRGLLGSYPYSPNIVEGEFSEVRMYEVLGSWTQVLQPIARNEKMMTKRLWISQALREPPISSILLPSKQPRNVASKLSILVPIHQLSGLALLPISSPGPATAEGEHR